MQSSIPQYLSAHGLSPEITHLAGTRRGHQSQEMRGFLESRDAPWCLKHPGHVFKGHHQLIPHIGTAKQGEVSAQVLDALAS